MIDKNFTLVSNAELAERRAYDVGNCIAIVLATLCLANDFDGRMPTFAYYPEVDAIGIRLDAIGDTSNLYLGGGAEPYPDSQRTVSQVLRERGYL